MQDIIFLTVFLAVALVSGLIWFTWKTKRRIEAAVPPRGAFEVISTGRLHYVDRGEGPAVVLIHGLGAQLGTFDQFLVPELAR